mgnify:FL=1
MEDLPTLSEVVLQDMPIDFFDFTFILNADWTMKECQFLWKKVDELLALSLWTIREKYMDKANRLKKRTKMFEEKQKNYMEHQEAWIKNRDHLQEHIRKSEAKLSEYKNVILAFWKLATTNPISK